MKIFLSYILFFLLGLSSTAQARQLQTVAGYEYPFTNRFLATATAVFMSERNDFNEKYKLELEILPNRNDVYLLEGRGTLAFEFFRNTNKMAPLIFLLSGFGGVASSGYLRETAEFLHDQGFHVITLPSPFNWRFALSAGTQALPGLTEQDAHDVYRVMQKTLSYVEKKYHITPKNISLAGFSMGGLHAAFVGKIDNEEKKIGLTKILLVNPPYSLLYGIQVLDNMVAISQKIGAQRTSELIGAALNLSDDFKRMIKNPQLLPLIIEKNPFTEDELQVLIGLTMKQPIADVIFMVELLHNFGVLKTPLSPYNRSLRLEEAQSFTLSDYVDRVLLPYLNSQSPHKRTFTSLENETSMQRIAPTFARDRRMFLIHNADDFTVTEQQLQFLQEQFGSRATIYPYGGHMGNLWYKRNQDDILTLLKSLL